jgi:hypothetical protein
MIKGAQKRMIVIKTSDSPIFEEAYFVLRRERSAREGDIVAEAGRIIESGGEKKRRGGVAEDTKALLLSVACFACGAVSGGCIAAAMFLI